MMAQLFDLFHSYSFIVGFDQSRREMSYMSKHNQNSLVMSKRALSNDEKSFDTVASDNSFVNSVSKELLASKSFDKGSLLKSVFGMVYFISLVYFLILLFI